MKQHFQILNDPRFHLLYGITQRFSDGPMPSNVRLNREGFTLVDGIKKKTKVYPGMLLAEHPSTEKGDLFAPIHGVVADVNERSLIIKYEEPAEDAPLVNVEPVNLLEQGLKGEELILAVKKLGVNTKSLGKKCKTLIINALNPDPGVAFAEPMLSNYGKTFHCGMELLKRFGRAENFILALPHGMQFSYEGLKVVHVSANYPNSLTELVIKNVTGQENPPDVACVGLHNLWSLGRVGYTGLPLTETVLTVGTYSKWENFVVKEGSYVGEILEHAKIDIQEGDTVLRGGPLRGESLDTLERSVTKGTHGVFVVESKDIPGIVGHSSCINCGSCVLVCPARISPSVLSRYAEFAMHEKCQKEHIFSCLDCGLCSYVCVARRPVLQYIRLAKHRLLQEEALRNLEEIQVEPEQTAQSEQTENVKA